MIFLIVQFYKCKTLMRETVRGCLCNLALSVPSLPGGCFESNPVRFLPPFACTPEIQYQLIRFPVSKQRTKPHLFRDHVRMSHTTNWGKIINIIFHMLFFTSNYCSCCLLEQKKKWLGKHLISRKVSDFKIQIFFEATGLSCSLSWASTDTNLKVKFKFLVRTATNQKLWS